LECGHPARKNHEAKVKKGTHASPEKAVRLIPDHSLGGRMERTLFSLQERHEVLGEGGHTPECTKNSDISWACDQSKRKRSKWKSLSPEQVSFTQFIVFTLYFASLCFVWPQGS
jgi:hypothetical protein